MMNRFITIIIISVLSVPAYSQTYKDYPALTRNDLPNAKFTTTREFSGESLYGYIDGGADLYLEYGFTKVTVTEFTVKKEKFKTEVWEMKDAESAFGIYSVSKLRCNERADFTKLSCLNKYQLQICSGQYYISIINESGSQQAREQSLIAGRILTGKISEPSFNPAGFFPGIEGETAGNEAKLVKGKLGVVNGFPELEEFFEGSEHCTSLILRSGEKILVSMNFDDAVYLKKFAGLRKWDLPAISASGKKMAGGELVHKTGENSLFIEISDEMLSVVPSVGKEFNRRERKGLVPASGLVCLEKITGPDPEAYCTNRLPEVTIADSAINVSSSIGLYNSMNADGHKSANHIIHFAPQTPSNKHSYLQIESWVICLFL